MQNCIPFVFVNELSNFFLTPFPVSFGLFNCPDLSSFFSLLHGVIFLIILNFDIWRCICKTDLYYLFNEYLISNNVFNSSFAQYKKTRLPSTMKSRISRQEGRNEVQVFRKPQNGFQKYQREKIWQ